jgi:prepilin-type N-terminal cleavage/methylation domain-containing protein
MRNSSAYTLIELLVGLSIIGLIFSFGYVSFREFSRRQALIGTMKALKGDLRLTQSRALSGQKPVSCASTLNGYSFIVTSQNTYEIKASCTGAVADKTVTLPGDIIFSAPLPPTITFKVLGDGTNIQAGSNVTLSLYQTSTGDPGSVIVYPGGEIE